MSTFSCREGNGFMRGADASGTGGEGLPATMLCVSSVGIDQCPGLRSHACVFRPSIANSSGIINITVATHETYPEPKLSMTSLPVELATAKPT